MSVVDTNIVALFGVYKAIEGRKPALSTVMGLLKKGELTGVRDTNGVWFVDPDAFPVELSKWMDTNNWRDRLGGRTTHAMPDGYVPVAKWTLQQVPTDLGLQIGLFTGSGKTLALSSFARDQLRAGVLTDAIKTTRGEWFAAEREVRAWLWNEWEARS